jgi:hypothetical protein
MTDEPFSHDFVYVHTDIPEGMTIREWRAQRAADRTAARRAAPAAWPPSALGRRLTAAVCTWIRVARQSHQSTPPRGDRGWCPVLSASHSTARSGTVRPRPRGSFC